MYDQFRQERVRLITESEVRLLEVLAKAAAERARLADEVRIMEADIQRLLRVLQMADRNAYESLNAARVAGEDLARAQALNIGIAPGVSTSPAQLVL